MKDWLLYTSTDMVNWQDRGAVASLKDFKWFKGENGAWACRSSEASTLPTSGCAHPKAPPAGSSSTNSCTAENRGVLCSGGNGIIFGNGIFFTKTCCLPDDFHKIVFWGGKHVRGKGISFQKL